jgi:hypothetical protein
MSSRQPLPAVMVRPHYCCTLAGVRMLQWGVFYTRAGAASKADQMCSGKAPNLRAAIQIERVYVSKAQR